MGFPEAVLAATTLPTKLLVVSSASTSKTVPRMQAMAACWSQSTHCLPLTGQKVRNFLSDFAIINRISFCKANSDTASLFTFEYQKQIVRKCYEGSV